MKNKIPCLDINKINLTSKAKSTKKVKPTKCAHCKMPSTMFSTLGSKVCVSCEALNNLTYWFPILQNLDIPVPETRIIHNYGDLTPFFDAKDPDSYYFKHLIKTIENEIFRLGGCPVFMRTEYLSSKHEWNRSCYVEYGKHLHHHIYALLEMSALAGGFSVIPFDFFIVRKLIDTKPYFTSFRGNMPITKEFRFFVENGTVKCFHPYWKKEVFERLQAYYDEKSLQTMNKLSKKDHDILHDIAITISKRFSGYWAIDFLKEKKGKWYCIDMAIGERAFHYEHK